MKVEFFLISKSQNEKDLVRGKTTGKSSTYTYVFEGSDADMNARLTLKTETELLIDDDAVIEIDLVNKQTKLSGRKPE